MSIEHRFDTRHPTQIAIQLVRSGIIIGSAVMVNVSAGGLAVDNADLNLRFGTVLEVNLADSPIDFDFSPHSHAMVIHASQDMAGLMFVPQLATKPSNSDIQLTAA